MIRFTNRFSSLLMNLALLALVVRSLVPAGFMPGQGAHNTYPLVICSGYGPVTIHVPGGKIPQSPGHESHDNMPCSFAQALAQGVAMDVAVPPVIGFITDKPEQWADTFNSYFTSKGYLSQGPPSFPA
jgi:hypothetical protein